MQFITAHSSSYQIFDFETKDEYFIRIRSTDNGEGSLTFEKSFTILVNDLLEVDINNFPDETDALVIYPNPFTESTIIRFSNPGQGKYQLYITDLTGKVVYFENDIYSDRIEFNRKDLPDGVYFVELRGTKIIRGRIIIE